jgi:membrane protein YdbS with pleckstrin-like domain
MHEGFSDNFALVAIVFWIFVILVTIVPIVLHHRRRMETEKTIRMAIEKGASLDKETLDRLLGASAADSANDSPENTRRGGVITGAVGVGMYFFAAFSGIKILMAVAALLVCIGIGIFVSAKFMKPKA